MFSFAYLVTKIMCFINVTAQYFFLNLFIGRDFSFWGYDVLKALITGEPWQVGSTVYHLFKQKQQKEEKNRYAFVYP